MPDFRRAIEILRTEGLLPLVDKALRKYGPKPLSFRYGLARTLRTPRLLKQHLKMNVLLELNARYHDLVTDQPEGIDVMAQDWDNLVILDACRYDFFEEMNDIDGDLRAVTSRATRTPVFLRENFEGETYHDTVYVSANPHLAKYDSSRIGDRDVFHDVVHVWDEEWDAEYGTILPEDVTEAALRAQERYPDKRLIVHYIQPHTPFIGQQGRELAAEHDFIGIVQPSGSRQVKEDGYKTLPSINYGMADVTPAEFRTAHRENLEIVLESVAELVENLDGKSVVSADHGELVGERIGPIPVRRFGHPDVYHPTLVTVPWLELEAETRRSVVSEPPVDRESPETEVAEERLRDLGYKA